MKRFGTIALAALMLGGAAIAMATPAAAHTDVGISFGFGMPYGDSYGPCDYYDYYDAPPPWGMPSDYCDYDIYDQPVFWGGEWYRGPIYYRMDRGERVYWLNGGWRHDEWRGARPGRIDWDDRGRDHYRGGAHGWNGGGHDWHGGDHGGHDWHGSDHGGGHDWHGGDHGGGHDSHGGSHHGHP